MPKIKYGFIVTKPLQLIIALSIIKQIGELGSKDVIIIDSFVEASIVFNRLQKKTINSISFRFFKTHRDAYAHVRHEGYDQIFIDSDVGGKKFITLFLHKIFNPSGRIAVYEEGVATYQINLDGYGKLFKLLKFFGVGTHFGGAVFVSEIFLYQPSLYCERFKRVGLRVLKIEESLSEFIDKNISYLAGVFGFNYKVFLKKIGVGESCTLYLTEWLIDYELIGSLEKLDKIIIKPHPHLKSLPKINSLNCEILFGPVPAEIVIKCIAMNFKKIIIYHHGSSVEKYICGESYCYIKRKMLSF